jgi:hypothetical protein
MSEGVARTHNAGVAGSSPAPAIIESLALRWSCGAFFMRVVLGHIATSRCPSCRAINSKGAPARAIRTAQWCRASCSP